MKRKVTTITEEYDKDGKLTNKTTEEVEETDDGYIYPQNSYPWWLDTVDPRSRYSHGTASDMTILTNPNPHTDTATTVSSETPTRVYKLHISYDTSNFGSTSDTMRRHMYGH